MEKEKQFFEKTRLENSDLMRHPIPTRLATTVSSRQLIELNGRPSDPDIQRRKLDAPEIFPMARPTFSDRLSVPLESYATRCPWPAHRA